MKVFVFLAPFIVAAALALAAGWVGAGIGRAREARERNGIDPQWARQVEAYIADLVMPPATLADLNDLVVMPDAKRDAGRKLLYAAPGTAAERAERLARRRAGH